MHITKSKISWEKAAHWFEEWRDAKTHLQVESTLPEARGRFNACVSLVSIDPPVLGIWRRGESGSTPIEIDMSGAQFESEESEASLLGPSIRGTVRGCWISFVPRF
jgi:hypothetical protein